jgi:hypothetical protein
VAPERATPAPLGPVGPRRPSPARGAHEVGASRGLRELCGVTAVESAVVVDPPIAVSDPPVPVSAGLYAETLPAPISDDEHRTLLAPRTALHRFEETVATTHRNTLNNTLRPLGAIVLPLGYTAHEVFDGAATHIPRARRSRSQTPGRARWRRPRGGDWHGFRRSSDRRNVRHGVPRSRSRALCGASRCCRRATIGPTYRAVGRGGCHCARGPHG